MLNREEIAKIKEMITKLDVYESELSKEYQFDPVYDEAIWQRLCDEEFELDKSDFAMAVAEGENVNVMVRDMYECGTAVEGKIDGKWVYDEYSTIEGAMKAFAKIAREHNVKTCNVEPWLLDIESVRMKDEKDREYAWQQEYADACLAASFGDDSLMRRYERAHGIEKDYGPSNPWDAPGMSIHDFI